jgi:hypothetical protein
MQKDYKLAALILGVFLFLGLAALGDLVGSAALKHKALDRTVTVKGLSEREYPADIVIWPIQFNVASNDLTDLYTKIDANTAKIRSFLEKGGISADVITLSSPAIIDKSIHQYGGGELPEFRYSAMQTVTVYSKNIDAVRAVMGSLSKLGKEGIVFTGNDYQLVTEYIFTKLNEIKPEMIAEATVKAREVAEKFADDSESSLGKIRKASQGQFSISPRDTNNPHIKKVRVVTTVEYYLSD